MIIIARQASNGMTSEQTFQGISKRVLACPRVTRNTNNERLPAQPEIIVKPDSLTPDSYYKDDADCNHRSMKNRGGLDTKVQIRRQHERVGVSQHERNCRNLENRHEHIQSGKYAAQSDGHSAA